MNTIQEALPSMAGPLESSGEGWNQAYTFAADFPGFSGHFPGHPLVPAVVQVRMALRVIAQACQAQPKLCEITQAKFKAPILPNQTVVVSVRPEHSTGLAPYSQNWSCSLACANATVAQCRLTLEFDDAPHQNC